ncbi:MAG: hypothetical protein FWG61_00480 [Firmicutes bacterium]|nr:hypothetical protein [Bacillota bacterium]
MHIKRIIWQYRRDFRAEYECEHCGNILTDRGYDDTFFHTSVIPDMTCPLCDRQADDSYRPLAPKYPDGMQV